MLILPIICLSISGIITFFILRGFTFFRGKKYKRLLYVLFFVLFIITAFVAAATGIHDKWYTALIAPLLCAAIATLLMELIMPQTFSEATSKFCPPDYIHSVGLNEFMIHSFNTLEAYEFTADVSESFNSLIYGITQSKTEAIELIKFLRAFVDGFDNKTMSITPNAYFFTLARQAIYGKLEKEAAKGKSLFVDGVINHMYGILLYKYHRNEEPAAIVEDKNLNRLLDQYTHSQDTDARISELKELILLCPKSSIPLFTMLMSYLYCRKKDDVSSVMYAAVTIDMIDSIEPSDLFMEPYKFLKRHPEIAKPAYIAVCEEIFYKNVYYMSPLGIYTGNDFFTVMRKKAAEKRKKVWGRLQNQKGIRL